MTQVELPPYGGTCSPLDLVAIEIIFGRIFEVFWQMSQAAAAGAAPTADDKPLQKKPHQISLKKVLPLRYLDILFFLNCSLLLFWCALYCRVPDATELSKVVEQIPIGVLVLPHVAAASASPPLSTVAKRGACFSILRAWIMRRPIGKVIGPPSMIHAACSFADFTLHIYVPLPTKLEATNKALAEERASRQVVD
jgi:hypothetical protein